MLLKPPPSVNFIIQSILAFTVWLAVAGRPLEGSDVTLVLSDWALAVSGRFLESFFGSWGVAGSQMKNSCRSVLTASGHSIMIMWLPSSRTFRKATRRIWPRGGVISNILPYDILCHCTGLVAEWHLTFLMSLKRKKLLFYFSFLLPFPLFG